MNGLLIVLMTLNLYSIAVMLMIRTFAVFCEITHITDILITFIININL